MELRTAREAADAGLTRYFTGQPCRHGHVAERTVSNGSCVECVAVRRSQSRAEACERTKAWRKAHPGCRTEEARRRRERNPEKERARTEKWRQENREKVRRQGREGQARLRAVNPERERARIAAWEARREAKRAAEAGRPRAIQCEICGDHGKTVFDHCHGSGKFRGWLCDRCNRTLGQVKDSPALLRRMAVYLEGHSHGATDEQAAEPSTGLGFRRPG